MKKRYCDNCRHNRWFGECVAPDNVEIIDTPEAPTIMYKQSRREKNAHNDCKSYSSAKLYNSIAFGIVIIIFIGLGLILSYGVDKCV